MPSYRFKPLAPLQVRPGHRLAGGLRRFYGFVEPNNSLRDAAGQQNLALNAYDPSQWGHGPHGRMLNFDGLGQSATGSDVDLPEGPGPRSLAVLFRSTSAVDGVTPIAYGTHGSMTSTRMQLSGGRVRFGCKPDAARQFVASSSQSLSRASNATLQAGAGDFWLGGWVSSNTSSPSGTRMIAAKYAYGGGVNSPEYALTQAATSGVFRMYAVVGGVVSSVDATSFGVPTVGSWNFVLAWYNHAAKTLNIQVNNGAVDSAPLVGPVDSGPAQFQIGNREGASAYWDGKIDSVAFGKNPPDGIGGTIAAIGSRLDNSGSGRIYRDLTAADKTAWGLVSWWDLDEPTGLATDRHGANHLTASPSSPTSVAGIPAGARNDMTGSVTVNDGQWHLAVVTLDATQWRLYVDGRLDATGPASGVATILGSFALGATSMARARTSPDRSV